MFTMPRKCFSGSQEVASLAYGSPGHHFFRPGKAPLSCLDSCLHLLAENFHNLKSIDISDNEISSLDDLALDIRKFESLKSLQIEGNPCYVYQNYPAAILESFPELLYLDGREVSPSDTRTIGHFSITPGGPQLMFYCYRILALKEPPKDQKHSQTIHVEVDLPFLEPHNETPSQTQMKQLDFLQTETTQSNLTGASKPSPKKASPYNRPNEVFHKFCFKTEQRTWSKSIEFPVLEISAPENDPKKLRDTFRNIATVRIVYLKTEHPKRPSKKKSNPNTYPEKVTKRVTLCSFKCSLESPSWSDETLDFYWADHPDVGTNAVKVDGCLRDMNYEGLPKPKYLPIAGRTSIPGRSSASEKKSDSVKPRIPVKPSHLPFPKILTCHVGFGIKRI